MLLDAVRMYLTLLKILVPALIVVKALEMAGGIEWLGQLLGPVMAWVGLPAVLGVVWAATLMTNLVTGLIVFFEVIGDTSLTVAQITVLSSLMLIGHSLPVEGAVARRAGVPWTFTILLRVGGALLLGGFLHYLYSTTAVLQEPAAFAWEPDARPDTLIAWALSQVKTLAVVFIIILALLILLRALKRLGIERLIHLALAPLLKLLGIGQAAANVTVIGVLLGLSYGAGLVIRDVDSDVMTPRDSFLTLCFLGLAHSMIEDTLLMLVLGADLSGIFWARLVFAILAIAILARCLPDKRSAQGALQPAAFGEPSAEAAEEACKKAANEKVQ